MQIKAAGFILLFAGLASAGTVSVTFDHPELLAGGQGIWTYNESGVVTTFYGATPTFIGDGSGGYILLVPYASDIYVSSADGNAFNLLSYFEGGYGHAFLEGIPNTVDRAHPGRIMTGFIPGTVPFDSQWENLSALRFCGYCISESHKEIDNLTLSGDALGAPEPGTVWLLLAAGAVILTARRPKSQLT